MNKSPKTFGYLKNTWSIRLLATYLSSLLEMKVSPMQTWWRIIHDLGIAYRQPKLELEKGSDYEEKKEKIDTGTRKYHLLFLKKILLGFEDDWNMATSSTVYNKNIYERKEESNKKYFIKDLMIKSMYSLHCFIR